MESYSIRKAVGEIQRLYSVEMFGALLSPIPLLFLLLGHWTALYFTLVIAWFLSPLTRLERQQGDYDTDACGQER